MILIAYPHSWQYKKTSRDLVTIYCLKSFFHCMHAFIHSFLPPLFPYIHASIHPWPFIHPYHSLLSSFPPSQSRPNILCSFLPSFLPTYLPTYLPVYLLTHLPACLATKHFLTWSTSQAVDLLDTFVTISLEALYSPGPARTRSC